MLGPLSARKEFPENANIRSDRRFSGYSATHCRVQLKEKGLSDIDARCFAARVEIQVASVFMHAWSEVEHDLVYKRLQGNVSTEELALVDQVNGLVMAGEIASESLQQAARRRISEGSRRFSNHYELAAHIVNNAAVLAEEPVNDADLGRADFLYAFIAELGRDTPDEISP